MTEQTELTRQALAAAFFAAKDVSRPVLGRVWSSGGYMTAADGFAAIQVEPASGPVPDGVVMTRQEAEIALRNTTPKMPRAILATDADGTRSITTDAKPKLTYTLDDLDDGIPPSIEKLFEDSARNGEAHTVYLNVELLEKLVKVVKAGAASYADGSIEFRVRGAHHPVEARTVTAKGDKVRAMIMPMVMSGDRFMGFDPIPAKEE